MRCVCTLLLSKTCKIGTSFAGKFCFEAMLSDDLDDVMGFTALNASASGLRCLRSIMQVLMICSWLELCVAMRKRASVDTCSSAPSSYRLALEESQVAGNLNLYR